MSDTNWRNGLSRNISTPISPYPSAGGQERTWTYNNPTKKLSVEICDVWNAGHIFEPCNEMHCADAIAGAVERSDSRTVFVLGRSCCRLLFACIRSVEHLVNGRASATSCSIGTIVASCSSAVLPRWARRCSTIGARCSSWCDQALIADDPSALGRVDSRGDGRAMVFSVGMSDQANVCFLLEERCWVE